MDQLLGLASDVLGPLRSIGRIFGHQLTDQRLRALSRLGTEFPERARLVVEMHPEDGDGVGALEGRPDLILAACIASLRKR